MNSKVWLLVLIYNLTLFVLIGWSIWYLKSSVPLFGLLAAVSYSRKTEV
jgi:hypothetical protein